MGILSLSPIRKLSEFSRSHIRKETRGSVSTGHLPAPSVPRCRLHKIIALKQPGGDEPYSLGHFSFP